MFFGKDRQTWKKPYPVTDKAFNFLKLLVSSHLSKLLVLIKHKQWHSILKWWHQDSETPCWLKIVIDKTGCDVGAKITDFYFFHSDFQLKMFRANAQNKGWSGNCKHTNFCAFSAASCVKLITIPWVYGPYYRLWPLQNIQKWLQIFLYTCAVSFINETGNILLKECPTNEHFAPAKNGPQEKLTYHLNFYQKLIDPMMPCVWCTLMWSLKHDCFQPYLFTWIKSVFYFNKWEKALLSKATSY